MDRIMLEMQASWSDPANDGLHRDLAQAMTEWLTERVPQWLADAGMPLDPYLPLFMNDAGAQNVTGSYRGYAKFKALQAKIDPQRLLSSRAGGFKY